MATSTESKSPPSLASRDLGRDEPPQMFIAPEHEQARAGASDAASSALNLQHPMASSSSATGGTPTAISAPPSALLTPGPPGGDSDTGNDNDQERPVREQLKKTSIGALPKIDADPAATEGKAMPPEATSETKPPTEHGVDRRSEAAPLQRSRDEEVQAAADEAGGRREHEDVSRSSSASPASNVSMRSSDSRPSTPTSAAQAEAGRGEARAHVTSPKKKRSRDQFNKDLENESEERTAVKSEDNLRASEQAENADTDVRVSARTTRDEPEKKRARDVSQESTKTGEAVTSKIPPTSGFANTSAVSPFGTLPSSTPKPETATGTLASSRDKTGALPQTSSSAFARSGFSSLATSSTSPFGALGGAPTLSSFASPSPPSDAAKGPDARHGFLSSSMTSVGGSSFGGGGGSFAAAADPGMSAFGRLGSFSTAGQPLSSFASKEAPGLFGTRKAPAAFGAPEAGDRDDDDDDGEPGDDDDDGDVRARGGSVEGRTDHKLQPLETETGEEGEETRFSARATLYHLDSATKKWKERGYGALKLNVSYATSPEGADNDNNNNDAGDVANDDDDVEAGEPRPRQQQQQRREEVERTAFGRGGARGSRRQKCSARLLMRSDAVYRLILNTPVVKQGKLGEPKDGVPTDRYFRFPAMQDGKIVPAMLRFGNKAIASELWHAIKAVEDEL